MTGNMLFQSARAVVTKTRLSDVHVRKSKPTSEVVRVEPDWGDMDLAEYAAMREAEREAVTTVDTSTTEDGPTAVSIGSDIRNQSTDSSIKQRVEKLKAKLSDTKDRVTGSDTYKKLGAQYHRTKDAVDRNVGKSMDRMESVLSFMDATQETLTMAATAHNQWIAEQEAKLRALTALEVDIDKLLMSEETKQRLLGMLGTVCNFKVPEWDPSINHIKGFLDILKNPLLYTHSDLIAALNNCKPLTDALDTLGVGMLTQRMNDMAHQGDAESFKEALAVYGVKPSEANVLDLSKMLPREDIETYKQINDELNRDIRTDVYGRSTISDDDFMVLPDGRLVEKNTHPNAIVLEDGTVVPVTKVDGGIVLEDGRIVSNETLMAGYQLPDGRIISRDEVWAATSIRDDRKIDVSKLEGSKGEYLFEEYLPTGTPICDWNPDTIIPPDTVTYTRVRHITEVDTDDNVTGITVAKPELTIKGGEVDSWNPSYQASTFESGVVGLQLLHKESEYQTATDPEFKNIIASGKLVDPDPSRTLDPTSGKAIYDTYQYSSTLDSTTAATTQGITNVSSDTVKLVLDPKSDTPTRSEEFFPTSYGQPTRVTYVQNPSGTIRVNTDEFNFEGSQYAYQKFIQQHYGNNVPDILRYHTQMTPSGQYRKYDSLTGAVLPGFYDKNGNPTAATAYALANPPVTESKPSLIVASVNTTTDPNSELKKVPTETKVETPKVEIVSDPVGAYIARTPTVQEDFMLTPSNVPGLYRRTDMSNGQVVKVHSGLFDHTGNPFTGGATDIPSLPSTNEIPKVETSPTVDLTDGFLVATPNPGLYRKYLDDGSTVPGFFNNQGFPIA